MKNLKTAAWILTVLFTLMFIYNIYLLLTEQSKDSSLQSTVIVMFGKFLGIYAIPGIVWLAVLIKGENDKFLNKQKKAYYIKENSLNLEKKKERIVTNEEIHKEYSKSLKSLNKLFEAKLITADEYLKKNEKIIIDNYNKVITIEEKQKETLLSEALAQGIISQGEYDLKKSTKSKVQFNKSNCPVCDSPLKPEENVCISCGLRIRHDY